MMEYSFVKPSTMVSYFVEHLMKEYDHHQQQGADALKAWIEGIGWMEGVLSKEEVYGGDTGSQFRCDRGMVDMLWTYVIEWCIHHKDWSRLETLARWGLKEQSDARAIRTQSDVKINVFEQDDLQAISFTNGLEELWSISITKGVPEGLTIVRTIEKEWRKEGLAYGQRWASGWNSQGDLSWPREIFQNDRSNGDVAQWLIQESIRRKESIGNWGAYRRLSEEEKKLQEGWCWYTWIQEWLGKASRFPTPRDKSKDRDKVRDEAMLLGLQHLEQLNIPYVHGWMGEALVMGWEKSLEWMVSRQANNIQGIMNMIKDEKNQDAKINSDSDSDSDSEISQEEAYGVEEVQHLRKCMLQEISSGHLPYWRGICHRSDVENLRWSAKGRERNHEKIMMEANREIAPQWLMDIEKQGLSRWKDPYWEQLDEWMKEHWEGARGYHETKDLLIKEQNRWMQTSLRLAELSSVWKEHMKKEIQSLMVNPTPDIGLKEVWVNASHVDGGIFKDKEWDLSLVDIAQALPKQWTVNGEVQDKETWLLREEALPWERWWMNVMDKNREGVNTHSITSPEETEKREWVERWAHWRVWMMSEVETWSPEPKEKWNSLFRNVQEDVERLKTRPHVNLHWVNSCVEWLSVCEEKARYQQVMTAQESSQEQEDFEGRGLKKEFRL